MEDILLHLKYQIHKDKKDKRMKEEFFEEMQKPFGGFLKASMANTAFNMGDMNLVETFS